MPLRFQTQKDELLPALPISDDADQRKRFYHDIVRKFEELFRKLVLDLRLIEDAVVQSDHGELDGLADDDHTQYHTDVRGDARYYTQTEHLDSSSGSGDSGKPIKLNSSGVVDSSMVVDSGIDHGELSGLADDDHTQYHNDARGDARYYTQDEIGSGVVGSSGANLSGINTINGSTPHLQMFVDGTQSSQYYSGGVVTENVALNGTIDITALTGYIKREDDNEAMNMGSFEIGLVSGQALSSGINIVCVDYNSGTPIFVYRTSLPNKTTIFPVARVYKDVNDHLHIVQGGSKFLGLPLKVSERFFKVEGLVRASGMITTEGTEDLTLDVSAGTLWRGINEFDFSAYDGDEICGITGAGTGGTISATNKIVLDSGCGDLTDTYTHGLEIRIHDSSNGNDGCYHVESSQLINADANTEVTIETSTLTIGNDTGHVHSFTFTYWNYTDDNGWIETNADGDHVSILIDVAKWNDITKNQGSQFTNYTSNRYGCAWVYASSAQGSRVHVVYGQGDYTLAQAAEVGSPATAPDIINKMCFLIAKIIFQEGDTDFYEIYYPWTTTFNATGASDHGGLAGLSDEADHTYAALIDGTRNITGDQTFDENIIVTKQVSVQDRDVLRYILLNGG